MNRDGVAALCCQPLNHAYLLCILLTKERLVGANKIKEPRDNGCDAGKVPGPRGAFKPAGEWSWIDRGNWLIGRIDLGNIGGEDEIRARGFGEVRVSL